jgi:defect in organelle trafficking protein DotD
MRGSSGAMVLLAVGLLTACADRTPDVPTTIDVPGMPNAEKALRESLEHVDAQMAAIGGMAPPPSALAAQPMLPAELTRKVAFRFAGALDEAVRRLAGHVGYTLHVDAPRHGEALTVAVWTDELEIVDILRALGEQMGTRATIEVDPVHHEIRVIHHV